MIFEHSNYRSFLREVLAEKVKKNPSYSLRALAKQLKVPSSQLSETLNGKANFSVATARRIAHELELSTEEAEYFSLSVQVETEKSNAIREQLIDRLNRFRPDTRPINDLSVDVFKQIADWHHAAILELVNVEGVHLTKTTISKRLGISELDAQVALDRLERLELLVKDTKGKWSKPKDDLQFISKEKSTAMRAHYRQILEKVSGVLETQEPFQERLSGYETLAFSKKALPEAQQIFDRFFEDMISLSKKYPKKTDVYHLVTHFFNLTPSPLTERKKK